MIKAAALLTFLVLFLSIQASTCEIKNYNQGISSNFTYKNKQYKSFLPLEKITSSSDFEIETSQFPKSISEIIKIGKSIVNKVDSEIKWEVQTLGLYNYHYGNCKYWYYQINYRGNNQYLYINIGLNGETPNLYRIDETPI
ncbi:MAG: hypothetical protein GTO02_02240 [Candidatus Dadabacteria bacterium]|nr:hypothetical protein [Candidatus Dadabacteria bacterium]NIQ13255.1 hypothetical protein [Candidatus Dadabacteria bacterium]